MFKRACRWFLLPGCFVVLSSAQAITLDWNNVTWTTATNFGGTTSQEFEIDASNPGNDIRVTISDPNNDLDEAISISGLYTGGFGAGQEALRVRTDNQGANQAITITIDFLYTGGVHAVDLTLFDIDLNSGQFQDIITDFTINGVDAGTTVTLTDSTSNEIVNSDFNSGGYTFTGPFARGTGASNTGNDDAGNLGINYGQNVLTSISFQYENLDPASGIQAIGLYDISYVVPEVSAAWAMVSLILCGLWNRSRKKCYRAQ